MGLDIKCKDVSTRCGYSYIHKFRKSLIEATIKYLENVSFFHPFVCDSKWEKYFYASPIDQQNGEVDYEGQPEEFEQYKKQLVDYLNVMHQSGSFISFINYRMLVNTQPFFRCITDVEEKLQELGIIGLKIFVDHSDCEGYFSPGQSLDILNWFARIEKFLIEESDEELFYQDMLLILQKSVDTKSFVYFC